VSQKSRDSATKKDVALHSFGLQITDSAEITLHPSVSHREHHASHGSRLNFSQPTVYLQSHTNAAQITTQVGISAGI